jgi:uncharacterized protein (DUF1778 family)
MPVARTKRQLPRARYFVNLPVYEDDLMLLDRAAAIRNEPRATYVRRTVLREARADIREAERKAAASSAA